MIELAFKLKTGSKMESRYYAASKACREYERRMINFFERYELLDGVLGFSHAERLTLLLTEELTRELRPQLLKKPLQDGCRVFRSTSVLQQSYKKEVLSDGILSRACANRFWWMEHILQGSYAMWSHNGTVYGYLSDKVQDDIPISSDMLPIKLSEYYTALEASEVERDGKPD